MYKCVIVEARWIFYLVVVYPPLFDLYDKGEKGLKVKVFLSVHLICVKWDAVKLAIALSCQNNWLILLHAANVWTLSSSHSWCVSNITISFIQYITENIWTKFTIMSFPVLVF